MSQKQIYVCPTCKAWYSAPNTDEGWLCSECKTPLCVVDIDYEEYCQMTERQREQFHRKYLNKCNFTSEKRGEKTEMKDGWISLLETICGFIIFAFILLGCFLLNASASNENYLLGILLLAVCCFVGFASVACMMVFTGMARDLRMIRILLEEK